MDDKLLTITFANGEEKKLFLEEFESYSGHFRNGPLLFSVSIEGPKECIKMALNQFTAFLIEMEWEFTINLN